MLGHAGACSKRERMRIAIDARLNAYRRGGIPQYTRQLLTALAEVAPDDEFLSLQHKDLLRPLVVAPNVTRRTLFTPPHNRWEGWTLPLELLPLRPHLLHCPDFIAPIRRPWPAVVTMHDLAFIRYPDILDADARAFYGRVAESSAHADGIIAVSEATRQDVAQFCDIPIEAVDLVYEAAAPMFRPMELRRGEVRVLNGEPVEAGSFLLFVSTLEPRKNLPTLFQALRICIDRKPERAYRLVIAGGRGWRDQPIFAAARELQLADHLVFGGNVGQYDLRWLYNACRLYVNPSLYEGFGLPLLEAMTCGAACLAADTSSLPEIGGDAAVYVPPLDAQAWADTIEALWDDTARREELGRLGIARAQRFSWQRAARETLAVYRRAIERRQRRQPIWAVPAARAAHPTAARPCPRCDTPLAAGMFQAPGETERPAWHCPRCGFAEVGGPGHARETQASPVAAPGPPANPEPQAQAAGDAHSEVQIDEPAAPEETEAVAPPTPANTADVVVEPERAAEPQPAVEPQPNAAAAPAPLAESGGQPLAPGAPAETNGAAAHPDEAPTAVQAADEANPPPGAPKRARSRRKRA
jgi:glycosyltransferase involved in cell wall biosynthesis